MSTIVLAVTEDLLVLTGEDGRWDSRGSHSGVRPRCLASDPSRPERVWCGTEDGAILATDDGGAAWRVLQGPGGPRPITAIAVGYGETPPVYAGYDPSVLFRSDDGGASWRELEAMVEVPSAPTWSFPPRPDTNHVRCLLVDPHAHDTVYACIEAGALLRSRDRGETWIDRVETGPYDTHTLLAHPRAAGRLYSAAGDGLGVPERGVQRSDDGGERWAPLGQGLDRHYGWGLAVDADDPDTLVVSMAPSPASAHTSGPGGESSVYRRNGSGWEEVREGLPEPAGTAAPALAAGLTSGVFYAGSNRGVYRSEDAGRTWRKLDVGDAEWLDSDRVTTLVATA